MNSNPMKNGKIWSEDEVELLKAKYVETAQQELLKLFPERSWSSICQKAHKLGLRKDGKRSGAKYWTRQEEDTIEKLIASKSVSEIAKHFDVPYSKMIDKIHKMGLNAKKARGETWSKDEDDFLKKHFAYAPRDYICRRINRPWSAIMQHGRTKNIGVERIARDVASVDYRFFDSWSEDVAYWLGFIMADGYLRTVKADTYLQVDLHTRDIDVIYKLAASLKWLGRIYISNSRNSAKLICNNEWLCKQIEAKGIPSKDKSFMAAYPLAMPSKYDRSFIRGLIDGDGWCSFNKKDGYDGLDIGLCGTKPLVAEVKKRIPFNLNSISITNAHTGDESCYHLSVRGKLAFHIAQWLYEDAHLFMDRKKQEYEISKQLYLNAPS